jgi:hypothetical protein
MNAEDARTRASDADRDETATALREHYAAGRLTEEEFNERLDKAYAAKTLGELDSLMSDLPRSDLSRRAEPSQVSPANAGGPAARFSPGWRAAWTAWLSFSAVLFVIWLLSGASGSLWFLWPAAVFGIPLFVRWISGTPAPSDLRAARREERRRRHGH